MGTREILAGNAVVELGLKNRMEAGILAARGQLHAFAGSVTTIGSALAGAGGSVLGAFAWPVKLAADMEQTITQFEVLLGSAAAAQNMVGQIEKMASATPFGTKGLSDAAALLLNFGVQAADIIPLMNNLGDASGGVEDRFQRLALAYGQASAKGRLMGGEVMQMVEAGFNPLTEIAANTGKSVGELQKQMEAGQLSIGMLRQAFASASAPGGRFAGMMAKQSQTAKGLWSTLLDTAAMVGVGIGNALIPALKLISGATIALISPVREWVNQNQMVVQVVAVMAAVATAAGGVLLGLAAISYGLAAAAAVLTAAITTLTLAWAALTSPLGLMAVGIIAASVAAYHFRDAIAAALMPLKPLVDSAIAAWSRMASIFGTAWGAIVQKVQAGDLGAAVGIAWMAVTAAFYQGLIDLASASSQLLDLLGAWIPGFDLVRDYASQTFGGIANALAAGRWDLVGGLMLAKLQLLFAQTTGGLSNLWAAFSIGFMQVWDGITHSVQNAWRSVVNYVFGTFDAIYTFVSQIGVLISKVFGVTNDQAKSAIAGLQARAAARGQTPANDLASRDRERFAAGQATLAANAARELEIRKQIAALEAQAGQAAADSPLASKAADALKALQLAVKDVAGPKAAENKELKKAAAGGVKQVGQLASVGTFSGAAAALFGLSGQPDERTAKNTESMKAILLRIERKKSQGAVFS